MLLKNDLVSSTPQYISTHSSFLRIGDVSFVVSAKSSNLAALRPELQAFACEFCEPDIAIDVEWADYLDRRLGARKFDSGAVWTAFDQGAGLTFDCEVSFLGSNPYKRMHVSDDFTTARVLLNRALLPYDKAACALDYPTDELLITNYLACHGLGVEVHGCGIIDQESGGHLFIGHSGAGKSTTTRLWETFASPEILSDDRIILRLQDDELWMYGTPWHGEAEFASPRKAKLDRILILQQGRRNQIRALSKSHAAGEVFARCFPPFHSPRGIAGTLEFIKRAVDVVPCYEFQFVPDRSAVNAVRDFHD